MSARPAIPQASSALTVSIAVLITKHADELFELGFVDATRVFADVWYESYAAWRQERSDAEKREREAGLRAAGAQRELGHG